MHWKPSMWIVSVSCSLSNGRITHMMMKSLPYRSSSSYGEHPETTWRYLWTRGEDVIRYHSTYELWRLTYQPAPDWVRHPDDNDPCYHWIDHIRQDLHRWPPAYKPVTGCHTTWSYWGDATVYSAPRLWNGLPACVTSASTLPTFKKHLKTHLFSLSFNPCPHFPFLVIVLFYWLCNLSLKLRHTAG